MQDFTKLHTWQRAQQFTVDVFEATEALRGTRAAGLRSQLRRAAASIGANIAEGAGQDGRTQFARYLQIAIGSTSEVESHLDLAARVRLLDRTRATALSREVREIRRMLAGLRKRILLAPTPENSDH